MSAPASRWKRGLFVVVGAAVGLGGVAFLGARELRRSTHTAYAYFDEALTGLEEGSSVRFRGVTVGRVERIRFAADKKHLEVQASLYDDYVRDLGLDATQLGAGNPLMQNLRAQVVMSWVTSTIVTCSPRASATISSSSSAAVTGSRPADGSSRNSSGGSSASARAMPARSRMPPETSAGRWCA